MMTAKVTTNPMPQASTAKELRGLPPAERDVLLQAAAAQAESEYRANQTLSAFEAFGEDDICGESANTLPR